MRRQLEAYWIVARSLLRRFAEIGIQALETAVIPLLLAASVGLLLYVTIQAKGWMDLAHSISAASHAPERIQAENEIARTFAQVLGGAFVLAGLYFTAKNVLVSRRGQVTERFSAALENLGDRENLLRRIGGVHALETIAAESPRDHWSIVELLAQVVRVETQADGYQQTHATPRADIQQILWAIGRRRRTFGIGERDRINLGGAYLAGADLRGTDFRGAVFRGAVLKGAILQRAHLSGADFSEADLSGSNCNLADVRGTNFYVARCDSARFRGALLRKTSFARASLKEVSIDGSYLREVYLTNTQLQGASLEGTMFVRCHFNGCSFDGASLQGSRILRPVGLATHQLSSTQVEELANVPEDLGMTQRPGKGKD